MDSSDEERLRNNRVDIAQILEPNDIIPNLFEDNVISEGEYEKLSRDSNLPRKERCQILLEILPRRGPSTLSSFITALDKNKYPSLVVKLNLCDGTRPKRRKIQRSTPCCKCARFIPQITLSPELKYLLNQNCCLLFKIDPIDFLDFYYRDGSFDEQECQLIRSEVTRLDRCRLFYCELSKRPSNAVISVLQEALKCQAKYRFIYEALKTDFQLLHGAKSCSCQRLTENDQSRTRYVFQGTNEKDSNGSIQRIGESSLLCETEERVKTTKLHYEKSRDLSINPTSRKRPFCPCHQAIVQSNISSKRSKLKLNGAKSYESSLPLLLNPASVLPEIQINEQKQRLYHYLNSLIFRGNFNFFENCLTNLRNQHVNDPDMCCMLSYVDVSRRMFESDYNEAIRQVKAGLLIARTKDIPDPSIIQVELLAAKARIYVAQKKFDRLQRTLQEALMIVKSDPHRCKGVAAGKLFFNNARYILLQMSILSFRNRPPLDTYMTLRKQALKNLRAAVSHFQEDTDEAGLFGEGCSMAVMAIVLLCCGENGTTMNILKPPEKDIDFAEILIKTIEKSKIPMTCALKIPLMMAKSDYMFRLHFYKKAEFFAREAFLTAENSNMTEFFEGASNRVQTLECINHSSPLLDVPFKNVYHLNKTDQSYFADVSDIEEPCPQTEICVLTCPSTSC